MDVDKECCRCHESFPASIFSKRGYICKPCDAACSRERRAAYRARHSSGTIDVSDKLCSTCQRRLPADQFGRYAGSFDGLDTACKQCKRAGIRSRELLDEGRLSREHTLYVFCNPLIPNIVKIGRTRDVNIRAHQLSESQPFEIEVCYEYPGYGFLELLVHDRVREWRTTTSRSREWFTMQSDQADDIIRGTIAEWELAQV
jgi:hypothetical protein